MWPLQATMKTTTTTTTMQYATLIFNHTTTNWRISYTNEYPLPPPEQSQKDFEIRILGPQTRDKLQILITAALDAIDDMPALLSSSSDDESENSD